MARAGASTVFQRHAREGGHPGGSRYVSIQAYSRCGLGIPHLADEPPVAPGAGFCGESVELVISVCNKSALILHVDDAHGFFKRGLTCGYRELGRVANGDHLHFNRLIVDGLGCGLLFHQTRYRN